MRSVSHTALQIGLVVIPGKLYKATEPEGAFRQVHDADGGKIRYGPRRCETCNREVDWEHIAKGKEVGDQMVVLTGEDLDSLPVSAKIITIERFIRLQDVEVAGFGDSYFFEPDPVAETTYALIRLALKESGRAGVAKFALREGGRDSLAVIYPRGKMLILQRMAWPAEIREPAFKFLKHDVQVSDTDRKLAVQLIESMSGPWNPEDYRSEYDEAVAALIAARLAGMPPPQPAPAQAAATADLAKVLTDSIKAAKDAAA